MHKIFEWDKQKNRKLIKERGISFEAVVSGIENGNMVATAAGKGKFSHQKQLFVALNNYIYIVPCVEDADKIFLKTILPSRKMTRIYLAGGRLK